MAKTATASSAPDVRIDYRNSRVFLEGRSIDQVWGFLSQLRSNQTSSSSSTTQAQAAPSSPPRRRGRPMSQATKEKLSLAAQKRAKQQHQKQKTMTAGA